jgi:hypothetical protein
MYVLKLNSSKVVDSLSKGSGSDGPTAPFNIGLHMYTCAPIYFVVCDVEVLLRTYRLNNDSHNFKIHRVENLSSDINNRSIPYEN